MKFLDRAKIFLKAVDGCINFRREKFIEFGDLILKIPVGIEILYEDGETVIVDIIEGGQTFVVTKGGNEEIINLNHLQIRLQEEQ